MIKLKGKDFTIDYYIENIYCLDNFSAFCVEINGIEYKTVEHAFQTIKFLDTAPEIANRIKNCKSPFDARSLAHQYKPLRRKDWSEIKYGVMEMLLTEKVLQNPYVKEKLINTKPYEIIEDCGEDDDKDWGCGLDGTGENNLGKMWMKIRNNLKNDF